VTFQQVAIPFVAEIVEQSDEIHGPTTTALEDGVAFGREAVECGHSPVAAEGFGLLAAVDFLVDHLAHEIRDAASLAEGDAPESLVLAFGKQDLSSIHDGSPSGFVPIP
jgi:hypothetical protein